MTNGPLHRWQRRGHVRVERGRRRDPVVGQRRQDLADRPRSDPVRQRELDLDLGVVPGDVDADQLLVAAVEPETGQPRQRCGEVRHHRTRHVQVEVVVGDEQDTGRTAARDVGMGPCDHLLVTIEVAQDRADHQALAESLDTLHRGSLRTLDVRPGPRGRWPPGTGPRTRVAPDRCRTPPRGWRNHADTGGAARHHRETRSPSPPGGLEAPWRRRSASATSPVPSSPATASPVSASA